MMETRKNCAGQHGTDPGASGPSSGEGASTLPARPRLEHATMPMGNEIEALLRRRSAPRNGDARATPRRLDADIQFRAVRPL